MQPLVSRIIQRAVGDAPPAVASVELCQEGELRLQPGKPWLRFHAVQVIDATAVTFRWTARVRIAPGVWVRVQDACEAGRGHLEARLWGLVPVARASGPEVDAGEALRYLAELPWCPYAYLGNHALGITQVSDTAVAVSLPLDPSRARVVLTVDAQGDVHEARAEERPRQVGDGFVPTPWSGRYTRHGLFGDVRAPGRAVVTWHLETGPFECFRGEVVSWRARPAGRRAEGGFGTDGARARGTAAP